MSKRRNTQLVGRGQFSFAAQEESTLVSLGLTKNAVSELEECAWLQRNLLAQVRSTGESKRRHRQLLSLQNSLRKTLSAIDQVDEFTLRMNIDLWCNISAARDHIQKLNEGVDSALNKMEEGADGRPETDLDELVYRVAELMLNHGLRPKRYGKQFRQILEIVFQTIGENLDSIPKAIDKAWEQRSVVANLASMRQKTIAELIEHRELGISED